jgi:toxin ParE1/3/4
MSGYSPCKISISAQEDLIFIGRYTQQTYGEAQRRHYLGLFAAAFEQLARAPLLGRELSAVRLGCRAWLLGKHVVIYQFTANEPPLILRIIHQQQDMVRHFSNTVDSPLPDDVDPDSIH